jgi:hypothetical protein
MDGKIRLPSRDPPHDRVECAARLPIALRLAIHTSRGAIDMPPPHDSRARWGQANPDDTLYTLPSSTARLSACLRSSLGFSPASYLLKIGVYGPDASQAENNWPR